MELGRCPSCGATRRKKWYAHERLVLWVCGSCGLGYSDPQPVDLVEDRYLAKYDLAEYFETLEVRKGVLNERRLDCLPSAGNDRKLLDIGCGDGQFAAAAAERGWTAEGVELNPPAAQKARDRGVIVHEGHVEKIDVGSTYDLITSWDVIEHVPDPRKFIERMVSFAAPGATIVVATLNRRSLVARTFRGRWSMVVEDHYTYWDKASLSLAFDSAGAAVTGSSSYGLGRDFVSWVDRWRGTASNQADVEGNTPTNPSGAQWDVNPVVLAAERTLNRFLDRFSLGVEVELVLRVPGP